MEKRARADREQKTENRFRQLPSVGRLYIFSHTHTYTHTHTHAHTHGLQEALHASTTPQSHIHQTGEEAADGGKGGDGEVAVSRTRLGIFVEAISTRVSSGKDKLPAYMDVKIIAGNQDFASFSSCFWVCMRASITCPHTVVMPARIHGRQNYGCGSQNLSFFLFSFVFGLHLRHDKLGAVSCVCTLSFFFFFFFFSFSFFVFFHFSNLDFSNVFQATRRHTRPARARTRLRSDVL